MESKNNTEQDLKGKVHDIIEAFVEIRDSNPNELGKLEALFDSIREYVINQGISNNALNRIYGICEDFEKDAERKIYYGSKRVYNRYPR